MGCFSFLNRRVHALRFRRRSVNSDIENSGSRPQIAQRSCHLRRKRLTSTCCDLRFAVHHRLEYGDGRQSRVCRDTVSVVAAVSFSTVSSSAELVLKPGNGSIRRGTSSPILFQSALSYALLKLVSLLR
jgi:hypothetical protein